MSYFTRNTFTYCLATILYTGAFSRLTNGEYTPSFYEYQEYHQTNDGSLQAQIVPFADLLTGTLLLSLRFRFYAAMFATVMFTIGMIMQIQAGKSFEIDIATIAVAVMATVEAR